MVNFIFTQLNNNLHGISSPPCGKSNEYILVPVTTHWIVPPLLINGEQIYEIFEVKYPITAPSFFSATGYLHIIHIKRLSYVTNPLSLQVHFHTRGNCTHNCLLPIFLNLWLLLIILRYHQCHYYYIQ